MWNDNKANQLDIGSNIGFRTLIISITLTLHFQSHSLQKGGLLCHNKSCESFSHDHYFNVMVDMVVEVEVRARERGEFWCWGDVDTFTFLCNVYCNDPFGV